MSETHLTMKEKMKPIPKVIWLQTGDEASGSRDPMPTEYLPGMDVTWAEDEINHGDTKYIRADLERSSIFEARLAATIVWLEQNQPDVFRRGLWDAIGEAAVPAQGESEGSRPNDSGQRSEAAPGRG